MGKHAPLMGQERDRHQLGGFHNHPHNDDGLGGAYGNSTIMPLIEKYAAMPAARANGDRHRRGR